jgi:ribosomal protein S27AE
MTRRRRDPRARRCALCGQGGTLALVLTSLRDVYAYRWLCARCQKALQ